MYLGPQLTAIVVVVLLQQREPPTAMAEPMSLVRACTMCSIEELCLLHSRQFNVSGHKAFKVYTRKCTYGGICDAMRCASARTPSAGTRCL